jgi:IS30 family transposase
MGTAYEHLGLEERCTIARLHEAGQSLRQIAAALDRAPSSISRELKRNSGVQVGYKPSYAQDQAAARRWSGSRLENDPVLQSIVLGCLSYGWSPEQAAGWLDLLRKSGEFFIMKEDLYDQAEAANEGI